MKDNKNLDDKWLRELVDKYTDYEECEEYHIHDGTNEHEGVTPLPHDFDEDKLIDAILSHLTRIVREARRDELQKLKDAHSINIFDEYIEDRLKDLNRGEHDE